MPIAVRIIIQTSIEAWDRSRTAGFLHRFVRGTQSNSEVSKDGRFKAALVIMPGAFQLTNSISSA
jgi:hypothetical protein